LSDEPLRLTTPDGRWAIEVSEDEEGQLCALVILDGVTTTESLQTDDDQRFINWGKRQMEEAMRRNNVQGKRSGDGT